MTVIERLRATGIRRRGSKKSGFRYRHSDGRAISSAERARIESLCVPPAWRDVVIDPSPRAAIQAIGRDAAGRWQYLYLEAYSRRRERQKYARLMAFAQSLPRLRSALARDLRRPGMPREKVLACALRILSCCLLRPGSRHYAEAHGSFGVATLRRRHVSVTKDTIRLDFPGKSGKRQVRQLVDARVARIVGRMLRLPGEVFKYQDTEGHWVDVRRRHLNEYIKEIAGERFSAKDSRTWAGTLLCACALARAGADPAESRASRRRKVAAAVGETAQRLGNTAAVCRASYIFPPVLARFEHGRVIGSDFRTVEELVTRRRGLHPSEKSLLRFLADTAV